MELLGRHAPQVGMSLAISVPVRKPQISPLVGVYFQCSKFSNHHFDYFSFTLAFLHVRCMVTCVQHFATPWTVALQTLFMGFSRRGYWSGLPFPPPGHLPDPGIEPRPPASPALAHGFFHHLATWKLQYRRYMNIHYSKFLQP